MRRHPIGRRDPRAPVASRPGCHHSWGFLFGLLAGSSLVFLGCVDMLFSLNEGNYGIGSPAMAAETAIEVTTLAGGPAVIAYLWLQVEGC